MTLFDFRARESGLQACSPATELQSNDLEELATFLISEFGCEKAMWQEWFAHWWAANPARHSIHSSRVGHTLGLRKSRRFRREHSPSLCDRWKAGPLLCDGQRSGSSELARTRIGKSDWTKIFGSSERRSFGGGRLYGRRLRSLALSRHGIAGRTLVEDEFAYFRAWPRVGSGNIPICRPSRRLRARRRRMHCALARLTLWGDPPVGIAIGREDGVVCRGRFA